MVDMFPFPSITSSTPEKQIAELLNYLIQFKETLEFALTNISTDNLSPELVSKLNEIGADIEKSNEHREEQITQVAIKSLTVSDVVNSGIFEAAVTNQIANIKFNVNFDTGYLEYSTP